MSSIFNVILICVMGYFLLIAAFYLALFAWIWTVIIYDKICELVAWPFKKLFP